MATQIGNLVFNISTDLKNLQGQLRQMEGNFQSSFSRIENSARGFGRSLGLGLGLAGLTTAMIGFTRRAVAASRELSNLSEQTQLSIRLLGGLRPILDQNSMSMAAFARSINQSQRAIAEGSDDTVRALSKIGLTLDEVRKATGDEFLDKLARGLAGIADHNERLVIGNKLLGRSYGELAPILDQASKGIRRRSAEFEAGVKALAAVGFTGQGLGQRIEDAWTSWIGGVVLGLGLIPRELKDIEDRITQIREILARPLPQDIFGSAQRNVAALRQELEALLQLRAAATGGAAGILEGLFPSSAAPASGDQAGGRQAESILEGLRKQATSLQASIAEAMGGEGAGLSVELDAMRDKLRELKVSPDMMREFERLVAQVQTLNEKLHVTKLLVEQETRIDIDDKELGESMRELASATNAWTERVIAAREELQRLSEIRLFQIADQDMAELANSAEGVAQEVERIHNASEKAQLDKVFREWRIELEKNESLARGLGSGFNKLTADIAATERALRELIEAGITAGDTFDALRDRLRALQKEAGQTATSFREIDMVIDGMLTGLFTGTQSLEDAMRNVGRNLAIAFLTEFNREMITKPLQQAIGEWLTGTSAEGSSSLGEAVAKLLRGQLQGGATQPMTRGISMPAAVPMALPEQPAIFPKLEEVLIHEVDIRGGLSIFANNLETEFLTTMDIFGTNVGGHFDHTFDMLSGITSEGLDGLLHTGEQGFANVFSGLTDALGAGLDTFKQVLITVAKIIGGILGGGGGGGINFSFGGGGAVPAFALGGPIMKGLPKFDDGGILAIVHPGEVVIKKPSVEKFGLSRLLHINETGELPAFRFGGLIAPRIAPARFQSGGVVFGNHGVQDQSTKIEVHNTIRGDVIPERGLTKDQVLETVIKNIDSRGMIATAIEQRTGRGT